ncbi:hypothetical protein JAAARDRAFT_39354 [Jaapia argillacea MUCL 33604]|uniref:Uncharacterized protein n=1 Tax=Jaapia argillacea MUCL 33604 TaxID=933084 RepID=A0A067PHF7_9AGAM|nr:hypothetical protein JAAARDRAFT_39354 [Jaapia argillacea MUCL 33604]
MAILSSTQPARGRSLRRPIEMKDMTLEQLRQHLGVTMRELDRMREKIHGIASQYIDVTLTWIEQDPLALEAFKSQVLEYIPELTKFEEAWPFQVIARNWLKRARRFKSNKLLIAEKLRLKSDGNDPSVVVKQEDLVPPMPMRKRYVRPNRAYVDLSACTRPTLGNPTMSASTSSSLPFAPPSTSTSSTSISSSSAWAPSSSASTSLTAHASNSAGGTGHGSTSKLQPPCNSQPLDPADAVKDWLAFHGIEGLYPQFADAGIVNAAKLAFSVSWSMGRRRKLCDRILSAKEMSFYHEAQLKVALGL